MELNQYLLLADLLLFVIMCAQLRRMNQLSVKLRAIKK